MVLQTKSTVILLLICNIAAISCNPSNNNMPLVSVDVQVMPLMRTKGSSTLISQSGSLVRLDTEDWQMFSNESDPYSYFPEGIHVERFDSLFRVDGYIVADTAYYFEKRELWQAIGNVVVKNAEGTIFKTPELFWDQKIPQNTMGAFYTNEPVNIVKPDGTVLYSQNGFTADQSLTILRFFSGNSEFYLIESDDTSHQSVVIPDSIQLP